MAAASSDVGYTFHARCGRRVKITNSSKTAERLHRLTEFNNAVVICSQPLEEGKLFEVKIDTKIATWSGSILVGKLWMSCSCHCFTLLDNSDLQYSTVINSIFVVAYKSHRLANTS